MKRNFVSAALALSLAIPFAGSVAFAQASTDPAAQNQVQTAPQNATQTAHGHKMHDPHKMAMKMSRKLGLSADQTAKVEPILAERQQKMMALRGDSTLTPDQKHTQMHAIAKSTKDELAGVLTPEQMQQMKHMHKEKKAEANGAAPSGM